MTVRTRQSYMDLCRSDRPWKGRDMADLVDKIYDVEEKADRASKVNATKLVQAKADGFDVAGEGFLQKREGKWVLSEPDFLTEEAANKIYARIRHTHNEYALRRHAPTHHYGGSDPLVGQSISGLRTTDSPTFNNVNASTFIATSNGLGQNYRVGDDLWIGDINIADTAQLSGRLNPAKANLKFGTGGPTLGFDGSVFSLSSGILINGGVTATNLAGPGTRPTVATSAGLIQVQDASTFRTTIDAAARIHAQTHHWDGSDPLVGQSISGLRTTSSPTFQDLNLTGDVRFGGLIGIGKNGYGEIFLRPSSGIVRFVSGESETYCTNAFSATSARFTNLSTGFVRSNGIGQLSSSALLASELPNHAPRHHWDGVDPLTGQSINGLRTSDSPRFYSLNLDWSLDLIGYSINTYNGDSFYVETSGGWQLIKSSLAEGTIITTGLFPSGNGIECGKNSFRWNFRSNDLNHEVETINATEAPAGTNIYQIPSVGNYFRLGHPTSGQNKDYRVPTPSSGIGKELILTCTSDDPNGFVRVYAPSGGSIAYNGSYVTYIEFVWGRKLVLHSDGVRWYV